LPLPRKLIACLGAAALFSLAACRSVPIAPPAGVSAEGINAIGTRMLGGFVSVRSDLYLPGAPAADGPRQTHRCEADGSMVSMTLDARAADQAAALCALALQAALQAHARHPALGYDIDLHLYPAGTGVRMQRAHLRFRRAQVSLVAPIFDDIARTRANLVDLIAHEGFHVLGLASHDPDAGDERRAYYAGLCTQLAVLGRVSRANLPGAPLASTSAAVETSSAAAYAVRREAWPWFEHGDLVRGSAAAQDLLAHCDGRL